MRMQRPGRFQNSKMIRKMKKNNCFKKVDGIARVNSLPLIYSHYFLIIRHKVNALKFYESLKPVSMKRESNIEGLNLTLFPYQERAVYWMVNLLFISLKLICCWFLIEFVYFLVS
jgi:hypothetical protein